MAKFNLSLLLRVSLVLGLAASSSAHVFGPHRRDHADLGRLVKKRSPIDVLPSPSSVQSPSTSSIALSDSSVAGHTTPTSSVVVQTTSEPASASESASPSATSGDLLSSVIGLLPTNSGTTSSSAPTSSLPSSDSSSTPQTSAQASKQPTQTVAQSATQSIMYLTTSGAPTPTQTNSSSSSSGMSHTAMTVFIVIAASVGAAVIVWTIIRKWKFRPSSDFEGRMQPIDWQPGVSNDDTGFPGQRRLSRASSFHSGSASGHADDQMRGGHGTSTVSPIPDHDFTAGPAHFAPVGGYADLARGSSPQPVMQESLGHAPSINRPVQYDAYGVPLHHGYNGY